MKMYVFAKALLVVAGVALFASACKKSRNPIPPTDNTITAVVSSNPSFSLLKSAVVKANLATTLSGPGPFTVFAPSDTAFIGSGITADVINTLTADQLKTILLYHTIPSKITAADVPAGPNAKVVTASGDSVFVTKNSLGVFVNGIAVVQADIPASNGVIHAIARVLLPPVGNLVDAAKSDSSLSFLVAAVVRASQGSTNLASILSSGGIFTIFAPTNNAFRAAGFPTIDAINSTDPNQLTTILTYHAIAGRVFSSDLSDGLKPATVNGETVTISLTGGAQVKGAKNSTAANIISTNTVATNGVIHKIDQVLLP